MKQTRINRADLLPKSFDLKKYQVCGSFSARDWLLSLEARVLVAYQLHLEAPEYDEHAGTARARWSFPATRWPRKSSRDIDDSNAEAPGEDCSVNPNFVPGAESADGSIGARSSPQVAKGLVDELLSDPVGPIKSPLEAMGLLKYFESTAVRDLRVWEYLSATASIGDERLKAYADAYQKYVSEPSGDMTEDELRRMEAPVWTMYPESGLLNSTEAYAHVNLECGEEKAVEDFRSWFRETKRAQGLWSREARISEAEMRDWARFQVLAYTDLQLWARANECEITHQVIGNSLFPNEFDTQLSDRVRKVVQPLSEKLMREEFCGTLRSQVLGDLSEAEQKKLGMLPE